MVHATSAPVVLLLVALASVPAVGAAEVSPALRESLETGRPGERQVVWVFFKDKGVATASRLEEARAHLTPRAQSRRRLRGEATPAVEDIAPVTAHVEAVAAAVDRVRHVSRWFNAASVEATPAQVRALEAMPFVARLDLVRRYRQRREELTPAAETGTARARATRGPNSLDYGLSEGQLQQIGVPPVHAMGLHGEGTVIAVFDTGFDSLAHEAFSAMSIVAAHDFVNNDDDVADGADRGDGDHGTATLSTIGGYAPGQLIGPAFAAHFILAKTENTESETPVEEDNWAAAAEWAEALGADVISSSLGYLEFDRGFTSYTFRDMNGEIAISTRAADAAAARGVVVVNSAGNSGANAEHNTLGAPADGKRVIAVGAVTSAGVRASFSSVGPSADGRTKPDLAAQGVAVRTALTNTVNRYAAVNGTSFSCPLTAGVAALVLQANPNLTPDQVGTVLRSTASQAPRPDNLLGWGIVNAFAAVQGILPRP